jgi:hypothetical protein
MSALSFVQFEFTHAIGPQPGRYVVASSDLPVLPRGAPDPVTGVTRAAAEGDVLAVSVHDAPVARGGRLRKDRARTAPSGERPGDVSVLRAALVGAARPLTTEAARSWLRACDSDRDLVQPWVAAGLEVVNLAIRAHRLATSDPYAVEVTAIDARAVRLGYGSAEQVASGRWEAAIVLETGGRGATRDERLVPAAAVADALAGRAVLPESLDLVLRALLDVRHGRPRAAALGLRAAADLGRAEFAGNEGVGAVLDRGDEVADVLVPRALLGPLGAEDERCLRKALEQLAGGLAG